MSSSTEHNVSAACRNLHKVADACLAPDDGLLDMLRLAHSWITETVLYLYTSRNHDSIRREVLYNIFTETGILVRLNEQY
jgi:hypothetical protein